MDVYTAPVLLNVAAAVEALPEFGGYRSPGRSALPATIA